MAGDLKRVSGLWLKDGKKGRFMSGAVEGEIPAGSKLLIFKNDKKTSDKQPDYQLYVAENPQDGSPNRPAVNGSDRGEQRPGPSTPPAQDEDSIPF